ncbi:MAG: hypothetical protein EXQ58_08035, partial [Acidobacteria bacterium]|nr:hypothetical protein [Acidobacteriota bacterium]
MQSMNRRTFLTGTLSAAVVAAGQRSPLEAQTASSKKDKYRVAIIGCGRMGQYYADVYKALPDTEIVAIAEWNDERRKVVGER